MTSELIGTPRDPHQIKVQIDLPGHPTAAAVVVEIGPAGCRLRYNKPDAPVFPLGVTHQGQVEFSHVERSFPVSFCPVGRVDSTESRTYGFEFFIHESVREKFVAILVDLFERRINDRVSPDAVTALKAIVKLPDGSGDAWGRICDISETGLAVVLNNKADSRLCVAEVLRIRLGLASNETPIELDARVRGRHWMETGILYRLQFDFGVDEEIRRTVHAYVDSRSADLSSLTGPLPA